jgi:hypothetical protein
MTSCTTTADIDASELNVLYALFSIKNKKEKKESLGGL